MLSEAVVVGSNPAGRTKSKSLQSSLTRVARSLRKRLLRSVWPDGPLFFAGMSGGWPCPSRAPMSPSQTATRSFVTVSVERSLRSTPMPTHPVQSLLAEHADDSDVLRVRRVLRQLVTDSSVTG